MTIDTGRKRELAVIAQVDDLNEEVRTLALNLAIYLAKTKNESDEISRLEPDFIRLVNGTVRVVQDLTVIINAARNAEKMVWDVSTGKVSEDLLEMKLRSIVDQCARIMQILSREGRAER